MKNNKTLEHGILELLQKANEGPLSIGDILKTLSGNGRLLILILLSLPFCQPLQIPGFSTPFGLAIAFVGLRMAFWKKIWLPQRILSVQIPYATLKQITDKTLNLDKKFKSWIYPRWFWITHYPFKRIVNGIIICVLGIFLALPLPIPLSNLTAGWAILFISLGLLYDDGVLVLCGYFISLLTIGFFIWIILEIIHFL